MRILLLLATTQSKLTIHPSLREPIYQARLPEQQQFIEVSFSQYNSDEILET